VPAETHRGRDVIDRAAVERIVAEVISDVAGAGTPVDRASRLAADVGLDDMTLLDVVAEIERALGDRTVGFTLDDEEVLELRTVGDLVDTVCAMVGAP
jgi:acyl carrier protein